MLSAMILAGGKGSRLGYRNKALLELGSQSLLDRGVARLRPLVQEIVVVVADLEGWRPSFPDGAGVRVVADIFPGRATLGGIYTGLAAIQTSHCLVVACDLPFLNVDLIAYMAGLAADVDALVPVIHGQPEPTHAIYSRTCLEPIADLLRQDRLKVSNLFARVCTRYLDEADVARYDPQLLSFFNVNTPDDLARAGAIARASRQ